MKYDDASWHYGGDFPDDLPDEAGATHAGMFIAWVILSGNVGEELEEILEENELKKITEREMTPGQFFLSFCDGKFTDSDVSEEIHGFIDTYFDFENGSYLTDYEEKLGQGLPSLYYIPDTWESYDVISPVIDKRFKEWKNPSPSWKFWKK